MVKINFEKMEQALTDLLVSITIKHIQELASLAASYGDTLDKVPSVDARILVMTHLLKDLIHLCKHDTDTYVKLGLYKKEVKDLIKDPDQLTPEQWQKIKEIRDLVQESKVELMDKIPEPDNEELIEAERKKHINKRYNIRESWLPIDLPP
jgi:hypothetical protein